MFLEIDGLNVFYERKKGEGIPVLILHGWGCNVSTVRPVFDYFAALGRDVTALDFVGFGQSDTPPPEFTVYDYARLTAKLIDELGLNKPDVIAHSFGGRVAVILASENRINRLLLTDAAGVKPKRGLRYRFKVMSYKLKRKLLKREPKNAGSSDYKALSEGMRRVFVSVVNTHLDGLLGKIKCPTLLVWGENDRDTPLYMAKRIVKAVDGSALIVMKNCGHFAYLDDTIGFNRIAGEFFKEKTE